MIRRLTRCPLDSSPGVVFFTRAMRPHARLRARRGVAAAEAGTEAEGGGQVGAPRSSWCPHHGNDAPRRGRNGVLRPGDRSIPSEAPGGGEPHDNDHAPSVGCRRLRLVSAESVGRFLVVLFVASCASTASVQTANGGHEATEARRALMTGRWYGDNQTRENGRQLELTDFRADGTFESQYRLERSGCVVNGSESGLWGLAGPIYFTITQEHVQGGQFSAGDPASASADDAYEVSQLDGKVLRYKCAVCGEEWGLRRVPESFTLPESTLPGCPAGGPETASR